MGRVDPEPARARLAAERREIEPALGHRGHQDDGDDAGWLEPGNLAANLYLDELEGLAEDLRDRLAALERAAQRLAAGMYGLSVESRQPIPDERFEAFPTTGRTVEEERALEEGRDG
jgi:DnaK suppressor protein